MQELLQGLSDKSGLDSFWGAGFSIKEVQGNKAVFFDCTIFDELANNWTVFECKSSRIDLNDALGMLSVVHDMGHRLRPTAELVALSRWTERSEQVVFSIREVDAAFSDASRDLVQDSLLSILRLLRAAPVLSALAVALRRYIRSLRGVLRASERPSMFCGVDWTRRIWWLLHGSHPPKNDSSVVRTLGGVQA